MLSGRTQQEIAQGLPARKTKQETAGDPRREWKSRPAKHPSKTAVKSAPPGKKKTGLDPASLKGAVKAAMPTAISPMKAALAETPPRGDEWLFEVKWDGVRAISYIDGGRIRMLSRNDKELTSSFPEFRQIGEFLGARQMCIRDSRWR